MQIRKSELRTLGLVIIISVIPVLLIYLPFMLHMPSFWGIPLKLSGMQQIFANWDGPNYVLNSITLYDPGEIAKRAFLDRPNEYYAAHFPLYSLLIRPLGAFFGYFWSAIVVQLLSGILLNVVFYYWVKPHTKHPLWLTFAFTLFPPRYLILRAVIAPELLLVACVIGALYFWKDKPLVSGVCAFVATLIKFQSLVFVPVYALLIAEKLWHKEKVHWQMFVSAVFPIAGYALVAFWYYLAFGDWNVYFRAQEIVGMGMSIPFAMFNYAQKWVATGWMETTALYFIAMFILLVKISRGFPRIYFWFTLWYIGLMSVIPQVDIMRLAMPLAPIFFLAFHEALSSNYFKYGLILSFPLLYLHTINFIMTNQAPIADWGLFR